MFSGRKGELLADATGCTIGGREADGAARTLSRWADIGKLHAVRTSQADNPESDGVAFAGSVADSIAWLLRSGAQED